MAGKSGGNPVAAFVCFIEGIGIDVSHSFGDLLDGVIRVTEKPMSFFHAEFLHIGGEGLSYAAIHPFLQCGGGDVETIGDHGDAQLLISYMFLYEGQEIFIQMLNLIYMLLFQAGCNERKTLRKFFLK